MNDDQNQNKQNQTPVVSENTEESTESKNPVSSADTSVDSASAREEKSNEDEAVADAHLATVATSVKEASSGEPKDEPKDEVAETQSSGELEEEPEKEVRHPKADSPDSKWYIVHTYSGHENKVAKNLKQRVQSLGFEDRIFDIIVPTRNTIKVSQGKKESVKEKIFPGYVLVKMILDDESWLTVRTTQGVTAFIGAGNKPTPISEKEVEAIQKFMAAEEPLYKTSFSVGEAVKITDGPFNDFLGTIDNIDEARGKLKVLVSIFGRETPVELDFLQVAKL